MSLVLESVKNVVSKRNASIEVLTSLKVVPVAVLGCIVIYKLNRLNDKFDD